MPMIGRGAVWIVLPSQFRSNVVHATCAGFMQTTFQTFGSSSASWINGIQGVMS